MYQVIYTKTLDNADDMVAESWEYDNVYDAIKLFDERVNALVAEMLNNEQLNCKMSIHKHKALIKIEGTSYCIALTSDEQMLHLKNDLA